MTDPCMQTPACPSLHLSPLALGQGMAISLLCSSGWCVAKSLAWAAFPLLANHSWDPGPETILTPPALCLSMEEGLVAW